MLVDAKTLCQYHVDKMKEMDNHYRVEVQAERSREEEVIPKQLVPRQPKYRLRNMDVAAQEFGNRDADHTDRKQGMVGTALPGTSLVECEEI
eukprot:936707-Amphidinium_carterae.1